MKAKVKAVAYETIQTRDGALPLLTPMSEVAGKMSVQLGAQFLEKHHGGRGVLLGGVPGVARGVVTIIGGGVVGINAAKIAIGMGARVNILDVSAQRPSPTSTTCSATFGLDLDEPRGEHRQLRAARAISRDRRPC